MAQFRQICMACACMDICFEHPGVRAIFLSRCVRRAKSVSLATEIVSLHRCWGGVRRSRTHQEVVVCLPQYCTCSGNVSTRGGCHQHHRTSQYRQHNKPNCVQQIAGAKAAAALALSLKPPSHF
jgi:hypothetical protein